MADQFVDHVRALPEFDPALVAGFLVVASRLVLIKSRYLLPRPPAGVGSDPGDAEAEEAALWLEERLRELQAFRAVAEHLRDRTDGSFSLGYSRGAPISLPDRPPAPLVGATPDLLSRALERLLASLPDDREVLPAPPITLANRVARVREALRGSGLRPTMRRTFAALAADAPRGWGSSSPSWPCWSCGAWANCAWSKRIRSGRLSCAARGS